MSAVCGGRRIFLLRLDTYLVVWTLSCRSSVRLSPYGFQVLFFHSSVETTLPDPRGSRSHNAALPFTLPSCRRRDSLDDARIRAPRGGGSPWVRHEPAIKPLGLSRYVVCPLSGTQRVVWGGLDAVHGNVLTSVVP